MDNCTAGKNNIGHIAAYLPGGFGLQYPLIGNTYDFCRIITAPMIERPFDFRLKRLY